MQTGTVGLIFLAAIGALAIVLFQYFYRAKRKGKLAIYLSFLRFVALFGILLLLINPKFAKNTFRIEKPNLVVLVDNSSSLYAFNEQQSIGSLIESVKSNKDITDRFNVTQYRFGNGLTAGDSLSFKENNTNITQAIAGLNAVYKNSESAIVLFTDGNQTLGEDYEFYGGNQEFPIYPIVLGDTTKYKDLYVGQVNTNRYAFLDNQYPVEAYIGYEGSGSVNATVNISINDKLAYRKNITLSATDNTQIINTVLRADAVGIKSLKVVVSSQPDERNTNNNQKTVAVEVIDEKTKVVIISNIVHPDIGALKKSIESNEQRSVKIYKPSVNQKEIADADLFILYQPTSSFRNIYAYIKKQKINRFTITGPKTDWNFLNTIQDSFRKDSYNQREEITPILNTGFSIFNLEDFSVNDFPPLESNLGEIVINAPHEIILEQRIKGVALEQPLLSIVGSDIEREAILFGENVWKWRVQSYRNGRDFKNFDDLIGKITRYLVTTKPKSRLNIEYQPVYTGSNGALISATYFDEAFIFDANAAITAKFIGEENGIVRNIPMLIKGRYYEADLSDLPNGRYRFTVSVEGETISRSGSFSILSFDVEQQFLSSNYQKLNRLATGTNGQLYFPSGMNDLVQNLKDDQRYVPIQKSKQNIVSLIDFKVLLGIILIALTAEWFIRKYNGLI